MSLALKLCSKSPNAGKMCEKKANAKGDRSVATRFVSDASANSIDTRATAVFSSQL